MEPSYIAQARKDMAAAERTIATCTERMATCQPRSRFAYAAQITKAESKRARAERTIEQYEGRWF